MASGAFRIGAPTNFSIYTFHAKKLFPAVRITQILCRCWLNELGTGIPQCRKRRRNYTVRKGVLCSVGFLEFDPRVKEVSSDTFPLRGQEQCREPTINEMEKMPGEENATL